MADAATRISMGELLCAFAHASDLAFGFQLDDALRSCYLALRIADQMGLGHDQQRATYYTALLKDAGCTSWTTELADAWQTDEIAARRELFLNNYLADRAAMLSWMRAFVARDRPAFARLERYVNLLTNGKALYNEGYATTAAITCRIAERIGMPQPVQHAALNLFERWNGSGAPRGLSGDQIPQVSRVVLPTFFLVPFHRVSGRDAAIQVARTFRGQSFDPEVVDAFLELSTREEFWQDFETTDIRSLVLEVEPRSALTSVDEARIDDLALAFADFVDLKSRFAAAHSRRVATYAEQMARLLDCPETEVTTIRRAALVHDLGLVAVPTYSLDRPWRELSEPEKDQYRLHPYHGERVLKQVAPLSPLAEIVGTHQERADGSGSYRGLSGNAISVGARIISVADRFDELAHDRAGEPAMPIVDVLQQIRREPFDPAVVNALGQALGEAPPKLAATKAPRPAGLTDREIEILRMAASGLTRRAIAQRLYLSENTVRHHMEHIYNKTSTSNRVSATLFAMENGILGAAPA